ncbi:hypothetical protein [Bacillus sp. 2205SS5-2]|uniref:hypothetical protein n=1 Tax=Bacillus sp. 2205SS5-2 TaxID=3109031 RepID=UPI003005E24C
MIIPKQIFSTWKKFDGFPMETLTKAWFYQKGTVKKQKDVRLMREHRERYGISGNCFDLTLWLLDEFKRDGIKAYPIGQHLGTEHAHVAVVALDEDGKRYLCDLGDQWLQPILVDEDRQELYSGFFPAANVQVQLEGKGNLNIFYHRPNGKMSSQQFQLEPIEMTEFMKAAEFSQNLIKSKPLLECRVAYQLEIAHWEFYNWESFLSTTEGIVKEPNLASVEEWVEKIHQQTGYDKYFLLVALEQYIGENHPSPFR